MNWCSPATRGGWGRISVHPTRSSEPVLITILDQNQPRLGLERLGDAQAEADERIGQTKHHQTRQCEASLGSVTRQQRDDHEQQQERAAGGPEIKPMIVFDVQAGQNMMFEENKARKAHRPEIDQDPMLSPDPDEPDDQNQAGHDRKLHIGKPVDMDELVRSNQPVGRRTSLQHHIVKDTITADQATDQAGPEINPTMSLIDQECQNSAAAAVVQK